MYNSSVRPPEVGALFKPGLPSLRPSSHLYNSSVSAARRRRLIQTWPTSLQALFSPVQLFRQAARRRRLIQPGQPSIKPSSHLYNSSVRAARSRRLIQTWPTIPQALLSPVQCTTLELFRQVTRSRCLFRTWPSLPQALFSPVQPGQPSPRSSSHLYNSSVRPPEVGVPLVAHAPVEESSHAADIVEDVLRRLRNPVNIPEVEFSIISLSWEKP
jgi:hypothetical protein